MSFINAVLNYGPGQENIEFRLHLRYEFLMLGIQPIIDKLRKHENETLDRHLDFFEMVRNEDERELARKFNDEHVDTKSASVMFDHLRRKVGYSAAYPHFLSLLQHMLLLPATGPNTQHWLIFDRVVQQVVLQHSSRPSSEIDPDQAGLKDDAAAHTNICDPDATPLHIDVKKIVKLLVKEEELVAARRRAEDLEKENIDMTARLTKKEQELDLRLQEKEDLETSLERLRERFEKESTNHSQAAQRAQQAELRVEELQHKYQQEQQERLRLERLVTEGSIPDDQKVAGLSSMNGGGNSSNSSTPPPPPPISFIPSPPCPPPPPPAPGKLPMLPAAPMKQLTSSTIPAPPKLEASKKNVPQPSNPLKSFNWSKLPDSKLQGTVWSELDESKMYNNIDLESIDKLFSAYQKNGVTVRNEMQ